MKASKKERQKKKFDKKNIIFIGLAVYLLILLISQQTTLNRNRQNYNSLQKKITQAEYENSKLIEENSKVGSDEYIEQKAREAGMVKPDEIVFITES